MNTVLVTHSLVGTSFIAKPSSNQFLLDSVLDKAFFYHEPDGVRPDPLRGGRMTVVKGRRIALFCRVNKTLPFGLAKDAIQLLQKNGYEVKVHNKVKRVDTTPTGNKFVYKGKLTPRKYQEEAAQAALNKRYGIICAPCGAGKTLIAARIIKLAQAKVSLLITDGAKLVTQTAEQLAAFFPDAEIVQWGDSKQQMPKNHSKNCIIVSTYQSFQRNRNVELVGQIQVVIADECHRIASDYFSLVATIVDSPQVRVGLTATDQRDNEDTILLKAYLGETLYKIDGSTLVENGFTCPAHIKTIDLEQMKEDELKNMLAKRKTIIVCNTIADTKKLHAAFPFVDRLDAQTRKKLQKERLDLFRQQKHDALIVTGFINTGVDIPDIDTVVIFRPHKSTVKAEQTCGRAQRKPNEGKEFCEVYYNVSTSKERSTLRWLKANLFNVKGHFVVREK